MMRWINWYMDNLQEYSYILLWSFFLFTWTNKKK